MLSSCLYLIANQNEGMRSVTNISLITLLANAMPAVSNTVSINVVRYFNVDLIVISLYLGFATWHKFQLQVPLSVWRSDRAKSN